MDMNDALKMLSQSGALDQVSQMLGVDEQEAASAITEVLPSLIQGMQGQAKNTETQQGFLQALSDHSKDNTDDIRSFIKTVDTDDGAKIVKHLLGADEEVVAAKAKKKSGIDTKTIIKIMAIVAPLLMSQMGKSAKASEKTAKGSIGTSDVLDIISGLSDGVDAGDIFKIASKLF